MRTNDTAESAAARILDLFQNPEQLPAALAKVYLCPGIPGAPCENWSIGNRLLLACANTSDARGFRQWQEAGRQVRKGAKALHILAPNTKKIKEEDGTERTIVTGFRGIPVFRVEDTDGPALANAGDPAFIDSLPLIEVARAWGITVQIFPSGAYAGVYFPGQNRIGLAVENLSVWAHELIHAADDRAGNLSERGQHWRSETVATFGSAVLLTLIGHGEHADLGGAYSYIDAYAKGAKLSPIQAALKTLDRMHVAITLILNTAAAQAPAALAS
jgi:hypothetical protein